MFDHDAPAPLAGVVATVIVFAAVGSAALAIYRLCFSPLALARVPGPKIAAITAWYEFYWDCVQQGRYLFKIEQMHQKYGPCLCFSPSFRPICVILPIRPLDSLFHLIPLSCKMFD